MAVATFQHGNPLMIDHTPASAVSAGDVITVDAAGLATAVAHRDIAAGELGAVAAFGGVYDMTATVALTKGDKVYFAADEVNLTNTNPLFGYAVEDIAQDAVGKVLHMPFV